MDEPTENYRSQQASDARFPVSNDTANNSEALTRRRLLKGAMATTPAIFTLQSGAARAAMSNMQCLAHPPKFTPQQHGVHVDKWTDRGESPNWKRSKVAGVAVRNKKNDNYVLVEIPQRYSYNKKYQDQIGRIWVAIADASGNTSGFVLDGKQHNPKIWQLHTSYHKNYFFTQRKRAERYKVVHVDKKGNYVPSSARGNPVTVSCWSSFASA